MRVVRAALLMVWIPLWACGLEKSSDPAAGRVPPDSAQPAGTAAPERSFPQEELIHIADAIRISGTLSVPEYQQGNLQIDVLAADGKLEGQSPVTTARVENPGEWSLLLPPGTKKVRLMAILDLHGDGPDFKDPFGELEGGPLDVETTREGIALTLDVKNVRRAPPTDPQANRPGENVPPWERKGEGGSAPGAPGDAEGGEPSQGQAPSTTGAAPAPGEASARSGPAPTGIPSRAAPGASDGPQEGADPNRPQVQGAQ